MTTYLEPADIDELMVLGPMPPVRDPYEIYRALRTGQPVYEVPVGGGDPMVLVTRYEDVKRILKDSATFSNEIVQQTMGIVMGPTVIGMDGKEHLKHRTLVTPSLTTRALKGDDFPAGIRRMADTMIDAFIDDGEVDIHKQFCYSFPLTVFVSILGLAADDVEEYHDYSKDLCLVTHDPQKGLTASEWLLNYLQPIVQDKRRNPGDDMISSLVTAEVDGEKLSDLEVVSFLRLLTLAGAETTNHLIGSTFVALLEDPDLMARVRADRSLVPALLHETMRWESPVSTVMRNATCDTQIAGSPVAAGTSIIVHIGSANRDERQFANPDTFDLDREDCDPLPFGYGPHYCAGSHLAKMEAEIGVNALLDRMDNIRVRPGEKLSIIGYSFRGPDKIPVSFDRAS
jgi:cytochrome P450